MSDYTYKVEGNEYVLYKGDTPVYRTDYGIALAYTIDEDIAFLNKHGNKDFVKKWYDNTRILLLKSGLEEQANSLFYVCGRLPVDELNKIISISGYVDKFHKKLMDNKIKPDDNIYPDIDEFL